MIPSTKYFDFCVCKTSQLWRKQKYKPQIMRFFCIIIFIFSDRVELVYILFQVVRVLSSNGNWNCWACGKYSGHSYSFIGKFLNIVFYRKKTVDLSDIIKKDFFCNYQISNSIISFVCFPLRMSKCFKMSYMIYSSSKGLLST